MKKKKHKLTEAEKSHIRLLEHIVEREKGIVAMGNLMGKCGFDRVLNSFEPGAGDEFRKEFRAAGKTSIKEAEEQIKKIKRGEG